VLWALVALSLACAPLSIAAGARADEGEQAPETPKADLTELSLQDLMNIEVTSASKKAEKLSETAAAVFVITQEDIRRSGVTTIPEALRMVPGVQVARLNASSWAISARGFNDQFAQKLLVLIDGRSVYTPLFSGVYWDLQDTFLDDIDRIEVIRGPGGALWGANAVNGVINIITKRAEDTQGSLLTTGMGTEEKGFAALRHGGLLGESGHYRVYAKWFDRDGGPDSWDTTRAGLRADWALGDRDILTAQGDWYDGDRAGRSTIPTLTPPFSETLGMESRVSGGNVLLRWERQLSDDSDLHLQLYYDRTEHGEGSGIQRDTFDLDFQHRFPLGERHEVLWGLGYRSSADDIPGSATFSVDPGSRHDELLSAFVQDQIALQQDRLQLTVGSKFERNDYTGFEVQPSARLSWRPSGHETAWAAVSRAVRTPSRMEHDGRVNVAALEMPGAGVTLVSLFANRDMESEDLLAYELGYRTQASDELFLDIAGFYNCYDDLWTLEPGEPFVELSPSPPHLVLPSFADNKMSGETYGVELAAQWQATDRWRLDAAYSFLRMDLHLDADSGDTMLSQAEGKSPRHQFSLRSAVDLRENLELDWWLRYVDGLPSLGVGSYVDLDVRLGWQPREDLELSIVGQNLFESGDPQFGPSFVGNTATSVERGVYAKATWHF
jgi:iron complex outermembrane receptor protein